MKMPIEYKVDLALESGADLSIIMFDHKDHSWIFEYRYMNNLMEEEIINKYRASIRYQDGVIHELSLMMDIIFPNRRGKEFLYGVDISKNSRLTLTFEYDKEVEFIDGRMHVRFQLGEVIRGCAKRLVVRGENTEDQALVKSYDFPFEVKDKLEIENGVFSIPFLTPEGEYSYFQFPQSIIKPLRIMQ